MPLPEKPFFALDELAQRWSMTTTELGSYAIAKTLILAIVVVDELMVVPAKANANKSEPHQRMLQGVVPVFGLDVWRAIKGEAVTLKRVLDKSAKTFLTILSEDQYQTVRISDLVVSAEEMRRFEAANGLAVTAVVEPVGTTGRSPRKSGAPVVIAWTGYWVYTCTRIFQLGIPETNAELVREGLDWFAANTDRIPDVRYVERAVQQLMAALRAS